MDYTAGQFVEITLDLPQSSGGKPKRWFTISSPPTQTNNFTITTRLYPSNPSDFKQALSNLKPGSTVNISDAMGDFVLPKDETIPLVFIARGIGITPFVSMIEWLEQTGNSRKITLIYSVRTNQDVAFKDSLSLLGNDLVIAVDHLAKQGHISNELDYKALPAISKNRESRTYISGPEKFVENLRNEFMRNNYSENNVLGDYFPGYENQVN